MKYFSLILIIFLLPIIVSGQTITTGSSDLGLNVSPGNPGPNATTTIKISSYAFDVTAANFTWTLNGKKVLTGVGKREYAFKTGPLGSRADLTVSAVYDGRIFEKKMTFYQNDVDLVWEVLGGYAPGFYQGKIFPAAGSTLRVIALPNIYDGGKKVAADKLTYTWSRNFKAVPLNSGLGKNTFTFTVDNLSSNNVIEVTASVPTKTGLNARRSVAIPTPPIQVILYPSIPLVGSLYGENISGEYRPTAPEVRLKAEVFNLSQTAKARLDFTWLKDNKPLSVDTTDPSVITFLNQGNASSSRSFLTVGVVDPLNIFQSARELLTVYLGNSVQF